MGFRIRGKLGPDPNATAQSGAVALLFVALSAQSYAHTPSATQQTGAAGVVFTANAAQSSGGAITPAIITTLTLSPTATATGLPVTFLQAFKAGDVPNGASVEIVGKTTQFEVQTRHPDNSVKHAILTVLTDTSAGVPQIVTLRTRNPVSGTAISKADVLASAFNATVSLNVGGTVYALDARSLLDGSVTPLQNLARLSGPQCSEFIVGAAVRNGGSPHAHLAAYFHVRAYGTAGNVTRVRCDVVVENGWTFVPGSNVFTYAATVTVGGATIYTNASLAHYHHTRWHQAGWWGGDPQVRATPNLTYLRETKAVPNYDPAVTPSATLLNKYTQTIVPMQNADLRTNWSPGGDHEQMSLFPEWCATYVMSGDSRVYNGVLANDSAGGSFSFHYRDENTGAPVSIDTYPNASEQDAASLVLGAGGNPLVHDGEHQPLLGYMSYLLTGDFFYLEELQFMANYGMVYHSAANRGYANGIIGSGTIGNREIAWSVRTQCLAGVSTPDALSTLKTYFTGKANNNLNSILNDCTVLNPNALGIRLDEVYPVGYYAGWQMDYLVSVLNFAVDIGYTSANAVALRNFVNQWPAGRLGQGGNGFCPTYAGLYNWGDDVADRGVITTGGVFRTFQQLYQYKFPTESAQPCPTTGPMWTYSYVADPRGYYATMQPALAMAVDAGVANWASWDKFVALGAPDYSTGTSYAMVPRVSLPAWYTALAVNQATQFSGTNLSALDPCPLRTCSYSGIDGQSNMISAWNGGVFDTNRDKLVVWGGGHNNYGGNEIYAFNLHTATWTMVIAPSDPAKRNDAASPNPNGTHYADGRPSSRHTAAALCFDARSDALFSTACGASYGDATIQNLDVDSFNFTTGTWKTDWPAQPGNPANGVGNGTICGYHPITGEIWAHPSGIRPLSKLNPATGVWTQYADSFCEYLGTGCLDSTRNRLLVIGSSPGHQFQYWDLNNPNAAPVAITTSGAAGGQALENIAGPGFVYDPVGDRYIGWNGGATLYFLNPTTWVWTSLTMTGFTPGSPDIYGTYGRFFYSPRIRGVGCVSATTENVWFCKL